MRIFRLLSGVCAAAICACFVSVRADDTPAQAAARAALMEQLGETNSQPAEVPAPMTPTNMPMEEVLHPMTPAPPPPISTNAPVAEPEPAATMPATVAPTINATEQTMATNAAAPPVEVPPPVTPTNVPVAEVPPPVSPTNTPPPPPPPPKKSPGKNPGLEPIVAPPLPISPEKQAQLQELLVRYKADQITPAQYQAARAKILAEP